MRSGYVACSTLLALSLVLAPASFGETNGSPVADAAMRGDAPALRALLQKKSDVNAAAAGWRDRDPVGCVSK